MLKRSEARNNAFILLFESSFSAEPNREDILSLAAENHEIVLDDFVCELFHGVLDHLTEIDGILAKYCRNRTPRRLSKMLLTALRIAVYEMEYAGTQPAVAINEALNIIKTYDSPESASYGNGVLASYVREK
ncbi:MAG: transcription antitermination factor NusB [Clostridia bacterium]|nr:transcription antitermination factor NusB [Clostridia bacterium]